MKKILLFLATVLILTIAFGCSKDNVAPTFSAFEKTQKPVNLVATFFKNTVAKDDSIRLTWEMANMDSVTTFLVAWSDSNVFDLGNKGDEYTNSLKKTYTLQAKKVLQRMGYVSNPDSFIVYFTVSAVYNKYQELTNFIGPRAVVDSALVYRK